MEKYGTYEIWEDTETAEIVKKRINEVEVMEKEAAEKWKRRFDLEELEQEEIKKAGI